MSPNSLPDEEVKPVAFSNRMDDDAGFSGQPGLGAGLDRSG